MKKRLFFLLTIGLFLLPITVKGAMQPSNTTLPADLEVGTNSIDGDSSGGLKFDPDNDGTDEVTIDTVGEVTAVGFDAGNGNLVNIDEILAGSDNSGQLILGGTGGTNNENLRFDFETTADTVTVTSTTNASTLKFTMFPLIPDGYYLNFGTGLDARIKWETTGNDNLQIGTAVGNAAYSGYVSIMEKADIGDADRSPSGTSANPVLRVYSSDATQASDYIEVYHDQTDGVLDVGNGVLQIKSTTTLTGDLDPEADGTRDLGTQTTAQWANVWADLVNGADYSFTNGWRLLEAEKYINYPKGIAIGNEGFENGITTDKMPVGIKPLFVITENFIEYQGVRISANVVKHLNKIILGIMLLNLIGFIVLFRRTQ